MAQLIYSPIQVSVTNKDIDIIDRDGGNICVSVDLPEQFYVENEIIISEFDESINDFCVTTLSFKINEKKILWILSQLKKVDIPKIIYMVKQYKYEKELSLVVPLSDAEIIKEKMKEWLIVCFYSKLTKVVDNENQTIEFTYY